MTTQRLGIKQQRIRFIRTVATDRDCFARNDERELPEAEAQDFIRAGHAVEAGDDAPRAQAKPIAKAR